MIKARDNKAIEMLEKIAQDVAPIKSARIASAIYHRGRLIAVGVNQNKSDPLQSRFARHSLSYALIHSEIATIKAALKRITVEELAECTLYVCRMKLTSQKDKGGTMIRGMCKPCSGCQMACRTFNIKRVVYTNDFGDLEEAVF